METLQTRTGGTVKLTDLFDEALERAEKLISEITALSTKERLSVVEAVGIGAVKYADLSKIARQITYLIGIIC